VAAGARRIPAICLLFVTACSGGSNAGDKEEAESLAPAGFPADLWTRDASRANAESRRDGAVRAGRPALVRLWRNGRHCAVQALPGRTRPDHADKVPIVVREELRTPVTLRGWRCRDSTPLRFWYRPEGEVPIDRNPASPQELERVGDIVAAVRGEPTIPGIPGYHGFFFSPPPANGWWLWPSRGSGLAPSWST
jgi:hypothetical protein